jgi:hypothetical protein
VGPGTRQEEFLMIGDVQKKLYVQISMGGCCQPVRLSLSAESVSHSAVFFSDNKSVNSIFCHGLSTKRYFLLHSFQIIRSFVFLRYIFFFYYTLRYTMSTYIVKS